MCKIGDIVGVNNYIGQDGTNVSFHYFIVVSDIKGQIYGYDFDKVCTVMSSFKTEKQRQQKLKHKENLEIVESEFTLENKNKKDGFIKADQLFYFDKSKTDYCVVGQVDGDVLIKLLEKIGYLDSINKLEVNISNLYKNNLEEAKE